MLFETVTKLACAKTSTKLWFTFFSATNEPKQTQFTNKNGPVSG